MKTLIAFFSLLFFVACKKDVALTPVSETPITQPTPAMPQAPTHDTLYPNSYLPAYPGSHWHYLASNGDTSSVYSGPNYVKDNYTIIDPYSPNKYDSDTFYVPTYGSDRVWGYFEKPPFSQINPRYGKLMRVVTDSLAAGTSLGAFAWSNQTTEYSRMVFAKDTTIVIGTTTYYPVVVMDDYYSKGPVGLKISRSYYAKNVGLIKHETFAIFPVPQIITKTILLQSYFINH